MTKESINSKLVVKITAITVSLLTIIFLFDVVHTNAASLLPMISILTNNPTQEQSTYSIYLPLITTPPGPGDCLTAEEFVLANAVNQYRNDNGLASVPVSKSLTQVAQWHVIDLHENEPDTGTDHGLPCNMHSWSDQGIWSPVCYTPDHLYASGMWNKPKEITSNVYTAYGYENAYGTSDQATASGALSAWQNSPGHNAVILQLDIWSSFNWQAMGVGIYEHHAVLWFGGQTDPQGTVVNECNVYNRP